MARRPVRLSCSLPALVKTAAGTCDLKLGALAAAMGLDASDLAAMLAGKERFPLDRLVMALEQEPALIGPFYRALMTEIDRAGGLPGPSVETLLRQALRLANPDVRVAARSRAAVRSSLG